MIYLVELIGLIKSIVLFSFSPVAVHRTSSNFEVFLLLLFLKKKSDFTKGKVCAASEHESDEHLYNIH